MFKLFIKLQIGTEHPEFGKLCEVLQDIPRKGDVMALKEGLDPGNFLPKWVEKDYKNKNEVPSLPFKQNLDKETIDLLEILMKVLLLYIE